MQEALSAAQNAVHSIFDARSAGARLAAAREGRVFPYRPHSAEQQGVAGISVIEFIAVESILAISGRVSASCYHQCHC